MLPHDKLDWNLSRLRQQLEQGHTDTDTRLAFARACVSKGRFHGGGELWFNEALTQARRILHHEPGHPEALVLGSMALVYLDRAETAERYLDEARRTAADDPKLHLILSELSLQAHAVDDAIAHLQQAVRLAGDRWEPHLQLGRVLAWRSRQHDGKPSEQRHAQYHLVRALQLGAVPHVRPSALRDLARLCLDGGRTGDAQRLLTQLLQHDEHRTAARYHLGRVAARLGKHKKAIHYFRKHLSESADERADVWARIGASYLHLGEPARAREACNRALAIDPGDLSARWILGSALLEEDLPEDATRVFREILELAPDHHDAFAELVRLRTNDGDIRWLRQALRSETAVYDRLGATAWRRDPQTGRELSIDPRQSTRDRIDALIKGLGRVDSDVTATVLGCLDLTTDEGLRFRLWEGVLELLAARRTGEVVDVLSAPGRHYSADAGRDVLTLAHQLSEEQLVSGLSISEDDLRRAAVERHGPADDVGVHRQRIEVERNEARAWQAMLLLAIASKRSASARNLLVRWSSDADDQLAVAARSGLAMSGDADAMAELRDLADGRQLAHLTQAAFVQPDAHSGPQAPRLVVERDDLVCATCGRRGTQVAHMVTGRGVAVCDICMANVHRRRRELTTRDPEVTCSLTGASLLDTDALFVYQGVALSAEAVDLSLGHHERDTIDAFLAAQ